MPRGWEGNRRSGVALAMRHGLKWFIHLRAQRPRVGHEQPAYAPAGAWLPLPFTLLCGVIMVRLRVRVTDDVICVTDHVVCDFCVHHCIHSSYKAGGVA